MMPTTQSPYAALLQMIQGGGPQGFTSPGTGPANNGLPMLPSAPQMGAGGMPQAPAPAVPSANSVPQGPFSQLQNNPMLMQMLKNNNTQSTGQSMPTQTSQGGAPSMGMPQQSTGQFSPDDIFRMQQMFANNGNPMSSAPTNQSWISRLLGSGNG